MPLATMAIERFGGMRLDLESMELGAMHAEDARDVRLREGGRLAPREAESTMYSALPTDCKVEAIGGSGGAVVIIGTGAGERIVTLDSATGAVINIYTLGGGSSGVAGITAYSTAGSTARDLGVAQGTGKLWQVTSDGIATGGALPTAIANPTGIGKIAYLPESNRLAVGDVRPNETCAVWFFEPESVSAVNANNFVNLLPGSGRIIEMVPWERQMVVVKAGHLFFFGAPSVDSSGEPVFDYRVVETGPTVGLITAAGAGRKGLYIASWRGIYVTRGGTPELISGPIQPLFDSYEAGARQSPLAEASNNIGLIVYSATSYDDAMYFGTADGTLIYDERSGVWTYDSYPAYKAHSHDNAQTFWFVDINGANPIIKRMGDEAGVAATARYRSGFYEPQQGADTVLRRSVLLGAGTVTLKQGVDGGALDAGSSVALGTATAPKRAARNVAKRGRKHQFELGGTGDWSVQRLEHHVGNARRPSVERP